VVVVDDSEIVLEQVKYVLEGHGITVVTVNSPFGLSGALLRELPDLALVDITMPGLQGDKLVEIVMRHHDRSRQCPIVLYSDRPTEQLQTLAKSCGAAGFIRKTGDEAQLVRSVRRFLPQG
jgi:CheY-like chemotaxis protein